MKALTEERWQEIRSYGTGSADSLEQIEALFSDVLKQHDHLDAQIKMLADYIMSERPDDPAWQSGEGACAMAVEIMKRQCNEISDLNGYCNLVDRTNNKADLKSIEQKIDALTEKFNAMIAQAHQSKVDLQMTRNMIETAEKENLVFPPFKIGK